MVSRRHVLCGALALTLVLSANCPGALALPPAAGTQAGQPVQLAADAAIKKYPDDRVLKQVYASVLADMGKVEEQAEDHISGESELVSRVLGAERPTV